MSRSAKSAHFCRGGGANLTMTDKNADDRQHFDEDDLIEHLVPDLDHPDVLPISGVLSHVTRFLESSDLPLV